MLKNIENLGKSLTKTQQKEVKGGVAGMICYSHSDCWNASMYLGPGDVSCRYSYFGGYYKVCVFN